MGARTDSIMRNIILGNVGEDATTASRALATAAGALFGAEGYASAAADTVKIYDDPSTAAGKLLYAFKATTANQPISFEPAFPIKTANGIYVQVTGGVVLAVRGQEGVLSS